MIIAVTEDHISRGIRKDCGRCPIALALKDKFPDKTVYVDNYEIKLDDAVYDFSAHNFIYAYDAGEEAYPFEFEMWELKYD